MNRLTPIKESMHHVSGYPTTLTLYKSAASRYYWVRCYFNGKYKIKTTKTESLKEAKTFAVQFYKDTLLSTLLTKTSDKRKQFAIVGQLFFKSTEKNSNTSTYKSDYNRYTQHIVPTPTPTSLAICLMPIPFLRRSCIAERRPSFILLGLPISTLLSLCKNHPPI